MHHGHTAMFGTYGMLSVALLLFSWRGLVEKEYWNDGILKVSFWGSEWRIISHGIWYPFAGRGDPGLGLF